MSEIDSTPLASEESLTRKIEDCRDDFPSLTREHKGFPLAFLDGPGGTQTPAAVNRAMLAYLETCNSNIHGNFIVSQESDAVIQRCRERLSVFLGASSWRCISLGANMTSLNLALSRAMGNLLKPGDEILISELDHEANRGPWLLLQSRGVIVKQIPLQQDGTLDLDGLERRLSSRTRLVAVGCSSNALGTVNDLHRIRNYCRDAGAYLLVDAVHYAPHFAIDVQALDCDFLLCSAYKFYGPHVGVLYSRPGLLEKLPIDRIASQDAAAPFCIESGTLNHEGLNGTIAAIDYIASFGSGSDLRSQIIDAMAKIERYEFALARHAYEALAESPGVSVYGPTFEAQNRAPTVAFTIDGVLSDRVATVLGDAGILVWDGDFAAERAIEVLDCMKSNGVVRLGISLYNTIEEVDRLIDVVRRTADEVSK